MFTGIIQALGRLDRVETQGGDKRLWIDADKLDLSGVTLGDSIAVNGVCLTAVELDGKRFAVDVSQETLNLTTLGRLAEGDPVNLEKALTLNQPLGGHLVSGHVDGVGRVLGMQEDARSLRMDFEVPAELSRYVARKGSITVNGVSLTVNNVSGPRFDVNLIPHTLQETDLGNLQIGDEVNLEVDLVARYLERLLMGDKPETGEPILLASLAGTGD